MQTTHTHAPGAHEVEHHHPGFLSKYVFSTDHKMIGVQYGVTALFFLLVGFGLMMLMRWQMAYNGQPVPVIGPLLLALLGPEQAPGGMISPDLYNIFGAMHGTIMV